MRFLTFNVFDLPPVKLFYFLSRTLSWDRQERLQAILRQLQAASSSPQGWDVVFLQELWSREYRELFCRESGYPYFVDLMTHTMPEEIGFLSGATVGFGSGLMILSRYPIEDAQKLEFAENGRWMNVEDGEISVHKGAISALIEHPSEGRVLAVNTHMVARYPDHQYARQRQHQLTELVAFTRREQDCHGCPVVLGGDFNFGPWQGDHLDKLSESGELFDRFINEPHIAGEPFRHLPGVYELPKMATYCGHLNGHGNPYVSYEEHGYQIIDHLLCSKGLRPTGARICFTESIAGATKPIPYSDHYGLEADFEKTGETLDLANVGND